MEKGIEEGIKQGIEKEIEQGIEQGAKQKKYWNSKKMLQENIDLELISKITGLSINDIFELKEK